AFAPPALSPAELRYLDKSPSPSCVFDRETARCLAANDAALRLYGYERDEFLGLALSDITHPGDLDHAILATDTRLPRHAGVRRHVAKSGEVIVVHVVVQEIVYERRAATLMLLLETTPRARAHMQRLDRERLFSALVENSPDVIARIDRELRHVYINPAVAAATGLTPEQVMSRRERPAGVPLELCARWAGGARRVFASGNQQELEFAVHTP